MARTRKTPTLRSQLLKTRVAFLAAILTLVGILLIMLNNWLAGIDLGVWSWLHNLPLAELGGILIGAGLLGSLFDYMARKVQTEMIYTVVADVVRKTLRQEAKTMVDTVLEGFAIHPEDLERVATPQLLDSIATNAMGCASATSSSPASCMARSAIRPSGRPNAGTTSR